MALEIRGRRTYDHSAGRQPARHQSWVRQPSYPDCHVNARIHEIDIAVSEQHFHVNVRMVLQIAGNNVAQVHGAERDRRSDAQYTMRRALRIARFPIRLVERFKDPLTALIVSVAGIGQTQPPRSALQQSRIQIGFDCADMLAGHRWR